MRFALFGRGEGVRATCGCPLWASTKQEVVTDASVSARRRGVRIGMSRTTVQALAPEVVLVREEEAEQQRPSKRVMERVYALLWRFSPWLETHAPDSFWLQVSGQSPPLREVRALLQQVDGLLTEEQRLRVGMASTPFLARALVEWSVREKIPGAIYRKAGRQQLILSPDIACVSATRPHAAPGLASPNTAGAGNGAGMQAAGSGGGTDPGRWLEGMPIAAMWLLPESTRAALAQFGVRRLQDLSGVGAERLCREFGKEALIWLDWLQPQPQSKQSVRVNYPPVEWQETRQAAIGEAVPGQLLWEVVEVLAEALALRLAQAELGGLTVGLRWRTEAGECGSVERVAKQPLWRQAAILAQIRSALESSVREQDRRPAAGVHPLRGPLAEPLESVTLYVGELRALSGTQLMFEIKGDALLPAQPDGENVERVVRQVNRRYPNSLRVGIRPNFRELRLEAVLGT